MHLIHMSNQLGLTHARSMLQSRQSAHMLVTTQQHCLCCRSILLCRLIIHGLRYAMHTDVPFV